MKKVGNKDDKTSDLFAVSDAAVEAADFGVDVKNVRRLENKQAEAWQVRLYPFDRYRGYGKKKTTEGEALSYVTWLMEKVCREGNSIVLERGGLLWNLWTYESATWIEEPQH